MISFNALLHLGGVTQHYPWGKPAPESLVAKLAGRSDCQLPCAEYWVGDHPNGCAQILHSQPLHSLSELLRADPDFYLGERCREMFGDHLPFLFKVLSIAEPLSIQCHPDKSLAKHLNNLNPQHYPDQNHKPEIAIALSKLITLQGFRSPMQIAKFFVDRPSIRKALLPRNLDSLDNSELLQIHDESDLLKLFSESLFRTSKSEIGSLCRELQQQLQTLVAHLPEDTFALRSLEQFPEGDPGIFCYYLLELKEFSAGEALFTAAGVPHAYLDGELVECMASSDNTIRAGLTSKFCDVEALLQALNYQSLHDDGLQTQQLDLIRTNYLTPAREFQMQRMIFESPTDISESKERAPELLFCLKGQCLLQSELNQKQESLTLRPGQACLIAADVARWSLKQAVGEFYLVQVPEL